MTPRQLLRNHVPAPKRLCQVVVLPEESVAGMEGPCRCDHSFHGKFTAVANLPWNE